MNEKVTNVLLVEDNPGDARLIEEMLHEDQGVGFAVKRAASVQECLLALDLTGQDVEVVLLDLGLPDENGLETLRRVAPIAYPTPVVVITGLHDEAAAVAAVREGAQDYVVKGQLEGNRLRRIIQYAIERQYMRDEIRNLSLQDELTGLYNRRGFNFLAEQQIKVADRTGAPFLLFFFDLDDLKKINDSHGHDVGDKAIVEAAGLLRTCFRQSDILARIGGDEFVSLMLGAPATSEGAIRSHLEFQLRKRNARAECLYPLTFSVGVEVCDPRYGPLRLSELMEKADVRMYEEKKRSKKSGAASEALHRTAIKEIC
ncbi:MAG TPA: diguanylate cyclase [Acidobacteriaceae bacterium]|jgi:diguanylate cyclase (GGDEF)-like protein